MLDHQPATVCSTDNASLKNSKSIVNPNFYVATSPVAPEKKWGTCSFDCQILVTSVVTLEEVKYMYFLIVRSLCNNHCVYSRRNCVHAFLLSYWTFIKREKNQEQYITIITFTPRHTKILITLIHYLVFMKHSKIHLDCICGNKR